MHQIGYIQVFNLVSDYKQMSLFTDSMDFYAINKEHLFIGYIYIVTGELFKKLMPIIGTESDLIIRFDHFSRHLLNL